LAAGLDSFQRGDYVAARRELKPLAEKGDSRAQYALGIMYLNGFLKAPSSGAAAEWLRRSASQGYIEAQTEMARMYRLGDGVPQDYAKMAEWYQRAAQQGDVGAQLFLADSYAYGYGVEPDSVRAYMWYEIAIQYWGPLAVRARDVVAEKMSPEQIAEAVRLAGKWLRENRR
ncbi:MAG: tetratricopeptide repeat protein, partial [Rhodospirillales bacterium]